MRLKSFGSNIRRVLLRFLLLSYQKLFFFKTINMRTTNFTMDKVSWPSLYSGFLHRIIRLYGSIVTKKQLMTKLILPHFNRRVDTNTNSIKKIPLVSINFSFN